MSRFEHFSNQNLRYALECRMNGNHSEGLKFLKIAAIFENCPEALYFLGQAYHNGGWGLHRYYEKSVNLLQLALQYGSQDAYIMLKIAYRKSTTDFRDFENDPRNLNHPLIRCLDGRKQMLTSEEIEWLKKQSSRGNMIITRHLADWDLFDNSEADNGCLKLAADLGDARCQNLFGRVLREQGKNELGFQYYLKSAQQCYYPAIEDVGTCYRGGIGCPVDYIKAFKWELKIYAIDSSLFKRKVEQLLKENFVRDELAMKELWYYGRAATGPIPRGVELSSSFDVPIELYNRTMVAVRQAVCCWMMVAKRLGTVCLNRDVVKLIAIRVWKSRKYPTVWGFSF